jgi:hypothetical protein
MHKSPCMFVLCGISLDIEGDGGGGLKVTPEARPRGQVVPRPLRREDPAVRPAGRPATGAAIRPRITPRPALVCTKVSIRHHYRWQQTPLLRSR